VENTIDWKTSPLGIWTQEFEKVLDERQAAEDAKRTEQKAAADGYMEKFRAEQKKYRETKSKENKAAEAEYIAARANDISTGTPFEQVVSACDMQIQADRRDTSRMRSVLFTVKDKPPKAMAA